MPVTVMIPTPLRPFVGREASVAVDGNTVGEALNALSSRYEELRPHLFAEGGRLRSFVNVYVNQEDIRNLQKDQTPLRDGDTIMIVPSIAGGENREE
jgi:MoaD family protein